MPDYNMNTAIMWANELSTSATLPPELESVGRRVELVEEFERKVMAEYLDSLIKKNPSKDQFDRLDQSEKSRLLKIVGELAAKYMPGVSENDRTSIALKLWAGCVAAGKTIAMGTRDGPSNEAGRKDIFTNGIDPLSRRDTVFGAGVEAAPKWKAGRREPVSYGGVPSDSAVRKYSF